MSGGHVSDTPTPGAGGGSGGEWIHGGGGQGEEPRRINCSGGWALPPLGVLFGSEEQDNG